MLEIADARLTKSNGSLYGTIWIKGWVTQEIALVAASETVKPYRILSFSVSYINGYTGRETQVKFFAVTIKEMEVKERDENQKA